MLKYLKKILNKYSSGSIIGRCVYKKDTIKPNIEKCSLIERKYK